MKLNDYLQKMEKEFGAVELDGRTYILLQQAYIDGPREAPHYEALAVCTGDAPDDLNTVPAYLVTWAILPETWEYWDNGGDDEGDACDWDNPDSVRQYGGWDLDQNRSC